MSCRRLKSIVTNPRAKSTGEPALYVALEHIAAGRGRLLDDATLEVERRPEAVRYEAGDVLFGKLRPYLAKVVQAQDLGTCSPELVVLRPRPGLVDSRYLYYLCRSEAFVDWAVATSDGVKMPRTDWQALGEFPLEICPDLDMQHRIAATLDLECQRIDQILVELDTSAALLDERRSAIVDAAIEDLLDELPRPLPRLKNYASVTVGIVITPAKWYVEEGGVVALRGTNVRPGQVLASSELVRISDAGNLVHRKSQLQAGDVVVVRTGNAGAAARVPDWAVGGNAIDLLLVRPGPRLESDYLEILLNSRLVRDQGSFELVGALQSHLNTGALRNVDVVVPTLDEQREIVRRCRQVQAEIDEVLDEMDRFRGLLEEHRAALILAAVTGRAEVAA